MTIDLIYPHDTLRFANEVRPNRRTYRASSLLHCCDTEAASEKPDSNPRVKVSPTVRT